MGKITYKNKKGEEIGYIVFIPRDGYLEQYQIFVREEERRRGIGIKMLEEEIKEAKKMGISRIGVISSTNSEKEAFGKWLVANGFKPTGEEGERYPQWMLEI